MDVEVVESLGIYSKVQVHETASVRGVPALLDILRIHAPRRNQPAVTYSGGRETGGVFIRSTFRYHTGNRLDFCRRFLSDFASLSMLALAVADALLATGERVRLRHSHQS